MHEKKEIEKLIQQLQKEPEDYRLRIRIGERLIAAGELKRGNDFLEEAAGQYAKQGFFLKGVALMKQVLERDRSRLKLREALAMLYEQLALSTDAAAQYQLLLEGYEAAGDDEGATRAKAALQRLLK